MDDVFKYRVWLFAWAILLVLVFLYCSWPANFYFVNDDFFHIPLSGHRVFGQTHLLRPVSEFTLWFDYNNWDKKPAGYHLTNIGIHILNVGLVYWFSLLLFKKCRNETAQLTFLKSFVTALFFLVYPFHVEAVYWILGRGASLACLFTLLTLIFYLKRAENVFYTILSLLFFVTGLFAYETTFVLPVMITLLHYFERNKKTKIKKYFNTLVWYWISFGAFLVMRYLYTGSNIGLYEAGNILGRNFNLLFYNLNTFIARSLFPPMASGKIFLTIYLAAVLLGVSIFVYVFKRRKVLYSLLVLAICLYIIALLPVISLGIDTHDTESDRFLYLPSCFFLIALTEIITLVFSELRKQLCILVIISVYFVIYLFVFSVQYKQASNITRNSMEFIGAEKKNYRYIYVINLPSQYKGAFIFRAGFKNALQWMCPNLGFEKLNILSAKEIVKPGEKINTIEIADSSWQAYKRQPADREEVRIRQELLTGKKFISGQDLIIEWTDSTITKIK